MKAVVSTEAMRGPLGEFILASVTGGDSLIGVCDTSIKPGVRRKTLYASSEPLVNFQYREFDDEVNRIIWQTSSIDKIKDIVGTKITRSCDAYFSGTVPLSKAITPVLELLMNGLYVVHIGKVYPTDGAGNFFWQAYNMKHEVYGSAPFNPLVGEEKCYSPPFLVPTETFATYSESAVGAAAERLAMGKKLGGIAFHITGMFSALLEGHINAAACMANDADFNCIIIEPLKRVIYGEPGSIQEKKVVALSCPYAKISFEDLSRQMTETFLINRRVFIPKRYSDIKYKIENPSKDSSALTKRPNPSIEKTVEGLPDAEMMYSAYAIDDLTDDDVNALLNGETEVDGKVIVSNNFYESLTYAANFLQLKSKRRFIDFAQAILINPDMNPAFVYISNRLKYIMDAKVNEIFKNIAESEDPIYIPIKSIAENYLKSYGEFNEINVKRFLSGAPTNVGSSSVSSSTLPSPSSSARSAADALIEFAGKGRLGPAAIDMGPSSSSSSSSSTGGSFSSLELSKKLSASGL